MFSGKIIYAFTVGTATPLASGSNADIWYWAVPFRCKPLRAGITVSGTAITSTADTVVKFDRIQDGSTRGNGDLGTITIDHDDDGIGTCHYEDSDYVAAGTGAWAEYIHEGDVIAVEVTTASTSGGNSLLPWLMVEVTPERPANNTAMQSS